MVVLATKVPAARAAPGAAAAAAAEAAAALDAMAVPAMAARVPATAPSLAKAAMMDVTMGVRNAQKARGFRAESGCRGGG